MKARKDISHTLSRISAAFFVLALIFYGCSSQGPKESLSLTILHTNDHHGHTLSYTHEERDIGGLAERITLIKKLKEQAKSTSDICLLLDAGDVSSGTLFSDSFVAEPDWLIYGKFYDAITPGNHDFDFPFDTTFNLIQKFKGRCFQIEQHV